MTRKQRSGIDPATVEAEVDRIAAMNKSELKALWREMHKSEPPQAFGPDLLRRSLAYKVQERAYGGLAPRVRRELDIMTRQIGQRPSSRIELPRRIKSGAVLMREWKGKIFRVTVVDDWFLHEGKTYSNLSEIAGLITGTNWNGPRFFGLRPSVKPDNSIAGGKGVGTGEVLRRRGRPRKMHASTPVVTSAAPQ
jgi:hypothetical protein